MISVLISTSHTVSPLCAVEGFGGRVQCNKLKAEGSDLKCSTYLYGGFDICLSSNMFQRWQDRPKICH